jgi:hypothetical protein
VVSTQSTTRYPGDIFFFFFFLMVHYHVEEKLLIRAYFSKVGKEPAAFILTTVPSIQKMCFIFQSRPPPKYSRK